MDTNKPKDVNQECRDIIKSGKYDKCCCPDINCEWHGNCHDCIIIHRAYKDHVPHCMAMIIKDKIKALANSIECDCKPLQKKINNENL